MGVWIVMHIPVWINTECSAWYTLIHSCYMLSLVCLNQSMFFQLFAFVSSNIIGPINTERIKQ